MQKYWLYVELAERLTEKLVFYYYRYVEEKETNNDGVTQTEKFSGWGARAEAAAEEGRLHMHHFPLLQLPPHQLSVIGLTQSSFLKSSSSARRRRRRGSETERQRADFK